MFVNFFFFFFQTTVTNGHGEANTLLENTNQSSDSHQTPVTKPQSTVSPNKEQSKTNVKPTTTTKSTSGFGGMKKGFMFGGSSSKPAQEKPKEESVPYIKKNEESLKLDEVQQAMSDTITKKKG